MHCLKKKKYESKVTELRKSVLTYSLLKCFQLFKYILSTKYIYICKYKHGMVNVHHL